MLGRAIVRLLMLVPFALVVAILAATAVLGLIAMVHGVPGDPAEQTVFAIMAMMVAPYFWFVAGPAMLAPSAAVALIGEVFAIRSWAYYVAAGGAVGWLAWRLLVVETGGPEAYSQVESVAAGFAGGIAYWLVAGWSAGLAEPGIDG